MSDTTTDPIDQIAAAPIRNFYGEHYASISPDERDALVQIARAARAVVDHPYAGEYKVVYVDLVAALELLGPT